MRLLNVAHGNPLRTGGASRVAYRNRNLAEQIEGVESLLSYAVEPESMGHHNPVLRGYDDECRASIVVSRTDSSLLLPPTSPEFLESWSEFMAAVQPDVVHVHNLMNLGVQFPFIVRRASPKTKLIFTAHEYLFECAYRGQLLRTSGEVCSGASIRNCVQCTGESQGWLLRRKAGVMTSLAEYERILAPSRFMASRLRMFGVPSDRITVVPNPNVFSDGTEAVEALRGSMDVNSGVRARTTNFLFLAASTPERGLLDLLVAFGDLVESRYHQRHPLLRVMIDWAVLNQQPNPWREQIDVQLNRLEGCIEVLPHMGVRQVTQVLQDSDVLVNASRWPENAPLTISDALDLGLEVVAPALGGIPDAIEGRRGTHLFLAGSRSSLEGALHDAMMTSKHTRDVGEALQRADAAVARDRTAYEAVLSVTSRSPALMWN